MGINVLPDITITAGVQLTTNGDLQFAQQGVALHFYTKVPRLKKWYA